MDSLKDLGAKDVVTIFQDYFSRSMLEMANKYPIAPFNATIRNEAYYAKQEPEPINPETHCEHCGHAFEDPWY